jgi:hypothetical protein
VSVESPGDHRIGIELRSSGHRSLGAITDEQITDVPEPTHRGSSTHHCAWSAGVALHRQRTVGGGLYTIVVAPNSQLFRRVDVRRGGDVQSWDGRLLPSSGDSGSDCDGLVPIRCLYDSSPPR